MNADVNPYLFFCFNSPRYYLLFFLVFFVKSPLFISVWRTTYGYERIGCEETFAVFCFIVLDIVSGTIFQREFGISVQ